MKVILIIICLLLVTACQTQISRVCFNDNCFEVELALTSEQRARGLMFREQMDEDKGMLFIFDKSGIHNFWMKNTLIPLDMIWIDKNRTVIYISRDTPPCETDPCPSYGPIQEAKYVLELNAGIADKIGLNIGDSIQIIIS